MPVNFLFSSGITTPTAFAAPVLDGMMFSRMPRPPRQSLLLGPSTVFCVPAPAAFAAPWLHGMMFSRMPGPPRQSLLLGPSTVFCVAVVACTVVMRPRLMPHLSCSTLATGARQLGVHEALEMIASPL